jgi:hypothetical protein
MLVEHTCIAAIPSPEVTLSLRCSYIYQLVFILKLSITMQSRDSGSENNSKELYQSTVDSIAMYYQLAASNLHKF